MKQATNTTSLSTLLKLGEQMFVGGKGGKVTLDNMSLYVLLSIAELLFTENRSGKLTLDDIETLSNFIKKGNEFLSKKLSNLAPPTSKSNNYGPNSYGSNNSSKYINTVSAKPEITQDTSLVISGDLQGTNFITDATISLYDPTAEIEQKIFESRHDVEEAEVFDEVEVLNNLFERVENEQQE